MVSSPCAKHERRVSECASSEDDKRGKAYLEAQIEVREGLPELGHKLVHALAFLESHDDVGSPVLDLTHHLGHIEGLRQALQNVAQHLFDLRTTE